MGGALIRGVARSTELALVGAVERAGHAAVGLDAGVSAGIAPLGLAIADDRDAAIARAQVVVDFTFHTEAPASIGKAVACGAAYVLGTTGLDDAERAAVEAAARVIPVVWAPNMSLGVNVLLDLVGRAAAVLGLDYDAEIVEMHHRHKQDAPSGTALGLGRALAAGRNQDLKAVARHGREGFTGERVRGEIGFHALRGGDVVGDHTVVFATDGERVELTHKASSRDCLASGALKAALWLQGRAPGLYAMTDVLGLGGR
jgi:4-hydroxy-tetrahydrodipicolinate reductase